MVKCDGKRSRHSRRANQNRNEASYSAIRQRQGMDSSLRCPWWCLYWKGGEVLQAHASDTQATELGIRRSAWNPPGYQSAFVLLLLPCEDRRFDQEFAGYRTHT